MQAFFHFFILGQARRIFFLRPKYNIIVRPKQALFCFFLSFFGLICYYFNIQTNANVEKFTDHA